MTEANFISQEDALELIGRNDVSFVDGSWYLAAQRRDAQAEYLKMRIPGAVYFDIDKIADQSSQLPHMLPAPQQFSHDASVLGISNDDLIIVYDGPGLFSAPRVWWTFKVMGAPDVRILTGGIDDWKTKNLPLETGNPNPPLARRFETNFDKNQIASLDNVQAVLNDTETVVLDARPHARFIAEAPEPREGLRGGHIPGSKSLPLNEIIENNRLKSAHSLDEIFTSLGVGQDTPVVTTCGSGVTAAVLILALRESGRDNNRLYDGSWSEWGMPDGPEIEIDEK
ncbi:MAG: 3-mercaptopyruvate sulfurtransferase [Pseudomonadota bacterium]